MIRVIFPQYALTSQMGTCTWRLQNIMTSKSSSLIKYIILWNTLFFLAKKENIWNFGQGRMVTDYEIVRCSQFNKDSRTIRWGKPWIAGNVQKQGFWLCWIPKDGVDWNWFLGEHRVLLLAAKPIDSSIHLRYTVIQSRKSGEFCDAS